MGPLWQLPLPLPSSSLATVQWEALLEDTVSLEELLLAPVLLEELLATVSLEVLPTLLSPLLLLLLLLSLLALARCPTSLCTSLCGARTGASPSQRLSDPLSLLLLTTLAPPTVSAPTGSDLLLSPPGLSATVLLLLLPMVLAMVLLAMDLLEELPTVLLVTVSATASLEELPTELVLEECSTDTLATTELPSSTLLSPVEKNTTRHQEQIRIGYRLPKLNSNLISIFIY